MGSVVGSRKPLIYQPLDSKGYQIRVAVLEPGPPEAIVRCTLETTCLLNPIDYTALSYCWGDPDITTKIIVNDVECQVTVNLADALQQLRSLNITHVWADALCINQASEGEKGHQIRYIKDVYSRANQTYAWLGKDIPGTLRDTILFLKVLLLEHTRLKDVQHSHLSNQGRIMSIFLPSSTEQIRRMPNSCQRCLYESGFRALAELFSQEYWKRRW